MKQAPVVNQTRVKTTYFTYGLDKVYGFDSPCPPLFPFGGLAQNLASRDMFSQRSLPSYNLIKPQQSTFKAARPQILVRQTRTENDFARKEQVRLGVKGKTTRPLLFQVPRIFFVHKLWLNAPSLRGFGAWEHSWQNAVRRCCWALIMARGPLHGAQLKELQNFLTSKLGSVFLVVWRVSRHDFLVFVCKLEPENSSKTQTD